MPLSPRTTRTRSITPGPEEVQPQSKRRKSSLTNYPVQIQQKVSDLVRDVLASTYYDINYLCIQRAHLHWEVDAEVVSHYRLQYHEATALLDQVVSQSLNPEVYAGHDPRGTLRRLNEFKDVFGWKILAICCTAEGFRRGVREIRHGGIWTEFLALVDENAWSLEVFARSRCLDWCGVLVKYADLGVAGLDEVLRPSRKMWSEHPHHIVQGVDRKIRRPWFGDGKQVHIDDVVFDKKKWIIAADGYRAGEDPQDPTIRGPRDGPCDVCGSPDLCSCKLDFSAGSLVELIDRAVTGTGVRALTNFKKGDILGQFVGELFPPEYEDDKVYSLVHVTKTSGDDVVAVISPQRFGNWTRYIAHSCSPCTKFNARTVGDRTVMTIEARRDIAAFEDLTVHYGRQYWTYRKCLCGEENCLSKKGNESVESEVDLDSD
ncbi:SET domain protein [Aspergillus stella-maris]|uniref:SET domain protein n=1 Tax=Aspergillus stella-maris TaxID=1810926 RepID=UPI003CCCEADF